MIYFEEPVIKRLSYTGQIINVRSDTARLHTGKHVAREVVEHPGGVVIAAVTESRSLLAVRQYRYSVGRELLELPAGKLERGEDPLLCAQRELSEETGFSARRWESLGFIYPSPGFCEEVLHLFLAAELVRGAPHPDEDEYLTISEVSFEVFWEMIMCGELPDAKTIAGVAKAERRLKEGF